MIEPPLTMSPSRMAAFIQCPQRFKFEYLDKLPSPAGEAAVRGTTVHRALELLFSEVDPQDRRPEALAPFVLRALDECFQSREWSEIADTVDEDGFCAEVARLSARLFDMEDSPSVQVHATEQRVEVEIDGWLMRGIIDRIDALGGEGFAIRDYKSSRSPSQGWEQKSMLGVDLYALMCREAYGWMPLEVTLLYLKNQVSLTTKPTPARLNFTRKKVGAVRAAIERACETEQFGCNVSRLCNWCPYKPICPAH